MTLGTLLDRRWLATTLLVLGGVLLCTRLGVWQLDRLAQRQASNSHVQEMRESPTLTVLTGEPLEDQEYRAVRVQGAFDFDHQVAIRNQAHAGQFGYRLFTPLVLAGDPALNSGKTPAVMVDRGWIPAEGNQAPTGWHQYDVPGQVNVDGVVRLGTSSPSFGGISQPTLAPDQDWADFWMYADLDGIGAQLPYPVLPIYVQLRQTPGNTSPPIADIPEIELTEGPHRGYAAQWFAFAAILGVGYPFYVVRKVAGQA